MKHNHSCTCKHESVKFCSHCNTIYCEGCNQEWSQKANWTYTYTPNTWPYSQSGTFYQDIKSDQGPTNIPLGSTTGACSHKG